LCLAAASIAGLLRAGPTGALPLHPCLAEGADCSLREIARAAGVRIGAAAEPRFIESDPPYGPLLAAEFDSLTAENRMKWPFLQPSEGVYDFAGADALVGFARTHDLRVRGHTLLWANPAQIPAWVNAAPDADTLRAWLEDHVRTVVGRYRDDVDAWDVVNEPLDNFGTTLYENVFFQQLGPDYIAEVFRIAHQVDPDARLFLNEVLVETPDNARFDAFYELVAGLLADGVPIHGVGFQGHLIEGILDPDPVAFQAAVQAFADLGLVVEITELDVAMPGQGADRADRQRETVHDFMAACLSVPACQGITFWGFSDAHSWIDGTFGPGLIPLPFDEDYLPKPAYEGARDALLERLARTVPEPSLLLLAASLAAALRRTG
jgi:endo-1,4-beta-xylanase